MAISDINNIPLPPGTHATILTGRDVVTGQQLAYPVVWADRPYTRCPRCGDAVARTVNECPVLLDVGAGQGGAIEEISQQHGCGEWLHIDWCQVTGQAEPTGDADGREVAPGITEADVIAAARQLAATDDED